MPLVFRDTCLGVVLYTGTTVFKNNYTNTCRSYIGCILVLLDCIIMINSIVIDVSQRKGNPLRVTVTELLFSKFPQNVYSVMSITLELKLEISYNLLWYVHRVTQIPI